MNAIQALTRPKSVAELRQLQQDYWREIQPLIRMKADMQSCVASRIFLSKDGTISKTEYLYTPEQADVVHQVDEALARIKQHFEDLAKP